MQNIAVIFGAVVSPVMTIIGFTVVMGFLLSIVNHRYQNRIFGCKKIGFLISPICLCLLSLSFSFFCLLIIIVYCVFAVVTFDPLDVYTGEPFHLYCRH